MLFKNTSTSLRTLNLINKVYFSAHSHPVKNVIQSKHNPDRVKQLRGNEQLQLHMNDYEKDFYYVHQKQRKLFSLYNVFSYLPSAITNQFANLVQDSKVSIGSDQIFLPRISENSIPIYESVGQFGSTLRTINKIAVGLPVFTLATAHMPFIAFTTLALHYLIYFKSSYGLATDRFVVKMQLLPQTEEIVFQKVTRTGCLRTTRVNVNDIQAVNPEVDPAKYKRNLVFERSIRSSIDINLIFRVKSTGQILMFEREGVWHEEALNHELMP